MIFARSNGVIPEELKQRLETITLATQLVIQAESVMPSDSTWPETTDPDKNTMAAKTSKKAKV